MTTRMWPTCGVRVYAAAVVVLWLAGNAAAQTPPSQAPAPGEQTAAGQPPATKTTWYFYTVQWGSQDEFLDLFQKNHYPLLKAQQRAGRFASVSTWVPQNHGDGRADWTFVVELVEQVGAAGGPTEQELITKMYPDQATFRKEERRRFELLVAHWDVPLNPVDLDTRKPGK
jgi:hypothetical protein